LGRASIFGNLPGDWQLDDPGLEMALTDLKEYFDRLSRIGKGRRAHFGREFCAFFIVSSWADIHGKAARRSDKVYEACEAYWQACGNEPSGDIDNWRRMVEKASSLAHAFEMHNFLIWIIASGTKLKSK
jgi:hypothetical protein